MNRTHYYSCHHYKKETKNRQFFRLLVRTTRKMYARAASSLVLTVDYFLIVECLPATVLCFLVFYLRA